MRAPVCILLLLSFTLAGCVPGSDSVRFGAGPGSPDTSVEDASSEDAAGEPDMTPELDSGPMDMDAPDVCVGTECPCPGTQIRCDGVCVDASTDPQHCGGCGMPCTDPEECISGVCACPTGEVCGTVGNDGTYIGGPCEGGADCTGDQCLDGGQYPDGTCSVNCSGVGQCPMGTFCIDTRGGTCLLGCQNNGECRADYKCDFQPAVGGGQAKICIGD